MTRRRTTTILRRFHGNPRWSRSTGTDWPPCMWWIPRRIHIAGCSCSWSDCTDWSDQSGHRHSWWSSSCSSAGHISWVWNCCYCCMSCWLGPYTRMTGQTGLSTDSEGSSFCLGFNIEPNWHFTPQRELFIVTRLSSSWPRELGQDHSTCANIQMDGESLAFGIGRWTERLGTSGPLPLVYARCQWFKVERCIWICRQVLNLVVVIVKLVLVVQKV